jgi:hypothetical protein
MLAKVRAWEKYSCPNRLRMDGWMDGWIDRSIESVSASSALATKALLRGKRKDRSEEAARRQRGGSEEAVRAMARLRRGAAKVFAASEISSLAHVKSTSLRLRRADGKTILPNFLVNRPLMIDHSRGAAFDAARSYNLYR